MDDRLPDLSDLTGAELEAPVVRDGVVVGSIVFRFVSALPVAIEVDVSSIVDGALVSRVVPRDALANVRQAPVRMRGLTIDAIRGALIVGVEEGDAIAVARVSAVDVERFLDFTFQLVSRQEESTAIDATIDQWLADIVS